MAYFGSCMCKQVRYEFDASLWCAHCHCEDCRKAHGSAFVTWVGVATAAFRITQGESLLRWYQSSAGARRGFCLNCGTTMLFEGDRWPDEMHLTRASLEGELDRKPVAQVYFDRRVPWLPNPSLKCLGEPGGEPHEA